MASTTIYVGCCGFPVARSKYFSRFKVVELQETFYSLPSQEKASSLAHDFPSDAVVTMKAWQVITHPHTSPTWKKLKAQLMGDINNYGYLKPSRENIWAWEKTVEIARILKARFIVLQTPPSMACDDESLMSVIKFLELIRTTTDKDIQIGWEIRGSCKSRTDFINRVVDLGIVHIVDPLRDRPIIALTQEYLYFRLHGLGGNEVNYRYKYSDEDLNNLLFATLDLVERYTNISSVFVFFNNVYMFDDGFRFKELASKVFKNVV